MCDRVTYCFQNTFKKDTACCNLLTSCGKILFVFLCIAGIYFGFMGVGKLLFVIVTAICNNNDNPSCNNYLKGRYEISTLFTWIPFQGFVVLTVICVSCMLLLMIGMGLRSIFNKPCLEIIETWRKSKYPNYENTENPTNTNDNKIVHLEVKVDG